MPYIRPYPSENAANLLVAGVFDRDVNVELTPGQITTMKESELLVLRGHDDNENELVWWVQYHLPTNGQVVHRSAHVHLKKATVTGEALAAELG